MVGFSESDTLTAREKLVAGCLSGVATRFITQPLDIMKLRLQLQKRKGQGQWTLRTAKRIYKEEGFFAFWHGHVLGQFHTVLAVGCQFYVYEVTTKYVMTKFDTKHSPVLKFVCGILAGCTSCTLVVPLEVIRVRQMLVKEQYKGIINGAKTVYRSGGFLAFYEGLGASLLQNGPQVGINFTVFSTLQPMILSYLKECPNARCSPSNVHSPEHLLMASSIAGLTAGFVGKTVTYPFDLAKRRLQIRSHRASELVTVPSTSRHVIRCSSLSECLTKTYKLEGFKGLYRGWLITAYKAQVTSFVAFTTYELLCYCIREMKATK